MVTQLERSEMNQSIKKTKKQEKKENNAPSRTNDLSAAGSKTFASITFKRNVARVPKTDEERGAPMQQVVGVKIYDMAAIRRRMLPEPLARLNELEHRLSHPFGDSSAPTPVVVPISRACAPADTANYIEAGVYRLVPPEEEARRPSFGFVNTFSVFEPKPPPVGPRRRGINHPELQNNMAYELGYKSSIFMNIDNVPAQLGDIYAPKGSVSDITASFYGYELSSSARQFYRFRDSAGTLFEVCRGMMGHVVMPEIQQIITSTVAGHKDFVKQQFVSPATVRVWIDNVRYTGTENIVNRANAKLAEACIECNVAMNIGPTTSKYNFIGIDWNHETKEVQLGIKTLRKFPTSIENTCTAQELEGLIGRLLFASIVRQEPLVNNWWTLKWVRRIFNALNTGKVAPDDIITLPHVVQRNLRHWLDSARRTHRVRRQQNQRTVTLFTDATLVGWGAVLIDENNRIFVAGGRFDNNAADDNISAKEARAVDLALRAFATTIKDVGAIDLFVDNTSVEATLRRGQVSAASMVDPIRKALEQIIFNNITLRVARIDTIDNPADAISRAEPLDVVKLNKAMVVVKQK
jgi:hypothetical protein